MFNAALIAVTLAAGQAEETVSAREELESLECLVGQWEAIAKTADGDSVIRVVLSWWQGKAKCHYLTGQYWVTGGPADGKRGRLYVGWNAAKSQIRGWAFRSDGSFGESVWTKDDSRWTVKESGVTANGAEFATSFSWTVDRHKLLLESRGHKPGGGPLFSGSLKFRPATDLSPPPEQPSGTSGDVVHDKLKEVAALCGRWLPLEDYPPDVEWTYMTFWPTRYPTLDGRFLLFDSRWRQALIGWDPAKRQLRQWGFMSDGGHEHHVLSKSADGWTVETSGITADGRTRTGKGTYMLRPRENGPVEELQYEEIMQIGEAPPNRLSILHRRPCLTEDDFQEPAPGRRVAIVDGIPGNVIDGYWLYLPRGHNAEKPWPVLLFLHGGGTSVHGDLSMVRDAGPLGHAAGDPETPASLQPMVRDTFIIVAPHMWTGSYSNRVEWYDQGDALGAILDSVLRDYQGDPARVYLTGLSRGGAGTWGYASKVADRIAAIVPVCGTLRGVEDVSMLKEMPIWVTHNTGDNVVRFAGSEDGVSALEALGADEFLRLEDAAPEGEEYLDRRHIFTIFDRQGHDAWTDTYRQPQIYRWLLRWRKITQ